MKKETIKELIPFPALAPTSQSGIVGGSRTHGPVGLGLSSVCLSVCPREYWKGRSRALGRLAGWLPRPAPVPPGQCPVSAGSGAPTQATAPLLAPLGRWGPWWRLCLVPLPEEQGVAGSLTLTGLDRGRGQSPSPAHVLWRPAALGPSELLLSLSVPSCVKRGDGTPSPAAPGHEGDSGPRKGLCGSRCETCPGCQNGVG